jgi:multisubunit Na+/H+ antiporter MnhB subunit
MYHVLADLVLVAHLAFVAFVVIGQGLIVFGGCRGWRWVRNPWFRYAHLAAIGLVVGQAWLGVICPLTDLEMALREQAGDPTYNGTFVAHWLHQILFFDAPPWVFTLGYTLFGLAVAVCWGWIRPRSFRAKSSAAA